MFTISKNMKLMFTRNSKKFGNIANRFDNLKSLLKVGLVLASVYKVYKTFTKFSKHLQSWFFTEKKTFHFFLRI